MTQNKICLHQFNFRKGWLDLPPSAKAPVYNDKIYIKALRLPQDVTLSFKNDLYKKTNTSESVKQKNTTNQNNTTNKNLINNNNDSSHKASQSTSPNKVLISNNSNIGQPVNIINNKQTSQTQKFNSHGGQKGITSLNQKSLICNQSKIIC